jgi:predicted nucleotidyltransferase
MSHAIDITPQERTIVMDILQRHAPQDATIWAFGSRTTGNAKPFSDLDLAIACMDKKPLPQTISLDLQEAFNESMLPWKVDIVDYNTITANFQTIIANHKQLIKTP